MDNKEQKQCTALTCQQRQSWRGRCLSFCKKVKIRFFVNLQGHLFCYVWLREEIYFGFCWKRRRRGCLKLIHSSSTIAQGFISFLSLLERVTWVSARSWTRETPSAKARSSTLHCHCKCTLYPPPCARLCFYFHLQSILALLLCTAMLLSPAIFTAINGITTSVENSMEQ